MERVWYALDNGLESNLLMNEKSRFDCGFNFRLIINEGLEIGSQMPYIRRARAAGYAVIVTNTNLNRFESPRFLRRQAIRSIRVNNPPLFYSFLKQ